MKYEVQFAGITGADGDLHRRGEILDESEISDLERQIAIGAVAAIEDGEAVVIEDEPPVDGEETIEDEPPTDEPTDSSAPTVKKTRKGKK